jgi:hypothetical protein
LTSSPAGGAPTKEPPTSGPSFRYQQPPPPRRSCPRHQRSSRPPSSTPNRPWRRSGARWPTTRPLVGHDSS